MKQKILLILLIALILSSVIALTVSAIDTGFYVDVNFTAQFSYTLTTLRDGSYSTVYTSFPVALVYDDLYTLKLKMKLDQNATAQGYTGYFVTYIIDGVNKIGLYTDLVPDQTNNYYIADDTYFSWFASASGGTVQFIPVNYVYFIDQNFGYTQGYKQGRAEQIEANQAQIQELQEQILYWQNQVYEIHDVEAAIIDAENRGFDKGIKEAKATKTFIQDTISTGIDGFSDVVKGFLDLQVLGIHVYQVILVACLIPLFIFILKRVTHG